MAQEPASIRYNNPGAQWDGPVARKWGSKQHVVLKDGQANHIAIFDTKLAGACAEFDLWRSRYRNLSLTAAIAKWCGGNSPATYLKFLEQRSDIRRNEIITEPLLASDRGLRLIKAQAAWEAGKNYPLSDADWKKAQDMVFKGVTPSTTKTVATGGAVAGTGVAAQQAAAAGYHWGAIVGLVLVGLIIAFAIWLILTRNDPPKPLPVVVPTDPAQARDPVHETSPVLLTM